MATTKAVDRLLYRRGLKLIKSFQQYDVPFTGIQGVKVNWDFAPAETFLRDPELNCTRNLGLTERQLRVLLDTEEEIRDSMSRWEATVRSMAAKRVLATCETRAALLGCQAGMNLVTDEIRRQRDPLGLEHTGESEIQDEELITEAAAAVKRETGGAATVEGFLSCVRTKLKYKYEAFEWVYEGLDPIMSSTVLRSRVEKKKWSPAALALALSSIGEHAGLMLIPMPAFVQEQAGTSSQNDALDEVLKTLPQDAALRLSSKTQGVAPEPGTWFLRVDGGNDAETTPTYIDCKKGTILRDISEKYPVLARYSLSRWRRECVLRTWQGLVDLAIQAHTRRGESDLVANWIYIKLCLDPLAVEWERALTEPEIVPTPVAKTKGA
jgi:hypothetical protein